MGKLVSKKKIMGIGPRLLNVADRVAEPAGAANGLLMPFLAKGGGSASGAINVVKEGIGNFSFSSPIDTTLSAINQPSVYPIQSGVSSIIGGLLAEVGGDALGGDIGGFLKKAGSAATKFGASSAFMGVLSAYFLEQKGDGGILNAPLNAAADIAGVGAGQNSRLARDNPDRIVPKMSRGVVTDPMRTEF